MNHNHPRMNREAQTVEAMIGVYCRGQHGTDGELCPECAALRNYARQRLQRCPFQEGKTTCAKCPVHCYKPDMRARIRASLSRLMMCDSFLELPMTCSTRDVFPTCLAP